MNKSARFDILIVMLPRADPEHSGAMVRSVGVYVRVNT